MKLKYFLSFFALIGLLASCSDDDSITLLDDVQVSASTVAIDMAGGETTITVNAKSDWAFNKVIRQITKRADGSNDTTYTETPDWLTVSPLSGGAGETKVTFSAPATDDGRSVELRLSCNGNTQIINVIQGLPVVTEATCAQVIAGPESKTYRVTGTVTRISNLEYGNWYLKDETGEIYIYGTLDAKGNEKNFSSLGIEVGDELTVEGPKTTYNGTVELVNVTVVKINKSLIKLDSLTVNDIVTPELPLEGGEIVAHLTCKGTGVAVEIPADAQSWLGVVSSTVGTEPTVTFRAAPNAAGDRSTTVIFKTTDGKKDYTAQATISQEGAIVDASVAEFLAAPVGDAQYRIQGVITKVAKAEYGNVYIKDFSGETYVYGIGAKGDFEKAGLKVGDIVTLVGKRGEYKGDAQMTGAQLEKSIPVTEISIADFLQKPDDKNTWYMVTGVITSLKDNKGRDNDYGNLYLSDGTNELYVYGCYPGWGATGDNRKFFIADNEIEVGDKLTMIGYKDTYNGLVELCGGVCFGFAKANAE
jgi:RPA family protein